MVLADFLTIIAILAAPIVAVRVSKMLDKRSAKHDDRLYIFRTLMGTRSSPTDLNHVNALNAIDVEFHGSDERSKQVSEAHKVYINHLNSRGTAGEFWADKREDLFLDLLAKMATCLGYRFVKSELETTSYFPLAYSVQEIENDRVRTGLLDLIEGKRALPIQVVTPPKKATEQEASKK